MKVQVLSSTYGELAHLVEHCFCTAGVRGSSPLFSTLQKSDLLILYKVFKRMRSLMFRTGVRFPLSPFHGDIQVSTGHKDLIC